MILTAALLLDAVFGEPRWLWSRLPHPAVLMGRAVSAADRHLNTGSARRIKGVAAILLLAAAAWLIGAAITELTGPIGTTLAAAVLLAQRSLCDHVRAVASALRKGLPGGRRSVALIVGRDTADMDGPAISRAAIESAAENLSDGVIAPAFWFAIAGLPGMMAYKMVNTADSMIGHRTPRHESFGWAAARLDDLLNLAPARLTALLLWRSGSARDIAREAGQHRSPNAGWPEAAMARALNIALSGPRSYHGRTEPLPWVHPEGIRYPGANDIEAATRLLWQAWTITLILSVSAALL
ncbi:MAG: adenosylcobinamide-phosphate synthase [Rhodobacterales bacterium]|nr:MAG: adenosylcobinamide-phosphate synthase [Rhodobacterales bacterium]